MAVLRTVGAAEAKVGMVSPGKLGGKGEGGKRWICEMPGDRRMILDFSRNWEGYVWGH